MASPGGGQVHQPRPPGAGDSAAPQPRRPFRYVLALRAPGLCTVSSAQGTRDHPGHVWGVTRTYLHKIRLKCWLTPLKNTKPLYVDTKIFLFKKKDCFQKQKQLIRRAALFLYFGKATQEKIVGSPLRLSVQFVAICFEENLVSHNMWLKKIFSSFSSEFWKTFDTTPKLIR